MKHENQFDPILMLMKDARILMLTVHLEMSRHTLTKISFSRQKREQIFKEIEAMQKRLTEIDTEAMQSSVSSERFIVFKANFLMFEHEVIDFVNLFHIRTFGKPSCFERDIQIRPLISG